MKEKDLLLKYLPSNSIEIVLNWIIEKNVHLKIAKKRNTKFGDYRPPIKNPNHRISINHDLNKYAFLITFVHELAHLVAWEKHGNKVSPHGIEWKTEYRHLMEVVLKEQVFPEEIHEVLKISIVNSKASSSSDLKLTRILKKYDLKQTGTSLEDIPENTLFKIENGKVFLKGNKRRTRYICKNIQTNKQYLFHPLTPIEVI
ncbi:MAG: SprT-like domain-containing protein [Bacteroidetes bacterium]|nr:SprT-like domain-containing protein [Bacteroidota bacterium]